jgi:hypothetical protein
MYINEQLRKVEDELEKLFFVKSDDKRYPLNNFSENLYKNVKSALDNNSNFEDLQTGIMYEI